jgi:hypothetical protein
MDFPEGLKYLSLCKYLFSLPSPPSCHSPFSVNVHFPAGLSISLCTPLPLSPLSYSLLSLPPPLSQSKCFILPPSLFIPSPFRFLLSAISDLIFVTDKWFNSSADNFPSTLEYLKFGNSFDQPIDHLPPSLRCLILGSAFNQPVNSLPSGLKHVSFFLLPFLAFLLLFSLLSLLFDVVTAFSQCVNDLPPSPPSPCFSLLPPLPHLPFHLPPLPLSLTVFI